MRDVSQGPVMSVTISHDGKIVAKEEYPQRDYGPRKQARFLAEMLSQAGRTAVYRLFGPNVSDRFHGYLFAFPPPGEKAAQSGRFPAYKLFRDVLNGKEDPGAWSWSIRRIDGHVHIVKRDEAGVVTSELVEGVGNAFVSMVQAHYVGCDDTHRALGGMFASFGIPYVCLDPSAEPEGGTMPDVPPGAAAGEHAVLQAASHLLGAADAAARRMADLAAHVAAAPPPVEERDTAPKEAKRLAAMLDLHPVHARRLATALRTAPDRVSLLADALESMADDAPDRGDTISLTPPRPTWESIQHKWRRNTTVDEKYLRGQYEHALKVWRSLYAVVGPKRSNNLVRRAIAAMNFDWDGNDKAYDTFVDRFGCGEVEDVFRRAIRPWPEQGWKGVDVGSTRFGVQPRGEGERKPLRRSATPHDLYRLFYLCKPVKVDFDDMYKGGIFGITSPCRRFAVKFYMSKYTLAGCFCAKKEYAVRTRDERGAFRIESGIPGADNGVATNHPDAKRFFRMVFKALHMEWSVYPGNNFRGEP